MSTTGLIPAGERRSCAQRIQAALLTIVCFLFYSGNISAAPDLLDKDVSLAIKPEPLGDALLELSRAADIIIMSDSRFTDGRQSPAVTGHFRVRDALTALLRDTGLVFSSPDNKRVFVIPEGSEKSSPRNPQQETETKEKITKPTPPYESPEDPRHGDQKEVVVMTTGSHIPDGSTPDIQIDLDYMNKTGRMSADGFIQTLPQQFNGGVNESSASGEAAPGGSYTSGIGPNLRGLGSDSTLILLNGHRMAPSGLGDYVEMSAIPSAAIYRIEILADEASAIYGSDAVAGVINVITLDQYDLMRSEVFYGYPSRGGRRQFSTTQTFSTSADIWRILLSYQYDNRMPLPSNDRNFTANAPTPLYLLPGLERNSLFVHAAGDFSNDRTLSLDILGSKRDYVSRWNNGGALPLESSGSASQLGGTLELQANLWSTWRLTASGAAQGAWSPSRNFLFPTQRQLSDIKVRSTSESLNIDAQGPVFTTDSGETRAAFGAQITNDAYSYHAGGPHFTASNQIVGLFGEVLVPLIGGTNAVPGIYALQLSLAGRYEHHTDFGDTANPRFVLSWYPISSLKIRATFGKSFKAPTLDETNQEPNVAALLSLKDPASATGNTSTLVLTGNAPHLRPEHARTWTVGFSWNAPWPELHVALTYFDVNYQDRLATPGSNLLNGLIDSGSFGTLVVRDPSAAYLQQLSSQFPAQSNAINNAPDAIKAVVDYRDQNLAQERMRGLDLSLNGSWKTRRLGNLSSQLEGQYLLAHTRQATPSAPVIDLNNIIFEPPTFRLRWMSALKLNALTASLSVNYTNRYTDNRAIPALAIGSYTTVDTSLSYDIGAYSGQQWAHGLSVSLYATNLLDHSPPFVNDSINHVYFDGANASALGRVIAMKMTKNW